MITKKDIKDLSDGVITPQTKLLIIAADFALEGDQHTELITGLKKNDIEYLQFIGLSVIAAEINKVYGHIVSWK